MKTITFRIISEISSFDYKNSKLIGHIREDVERRKVALTHKEYAILLTSLIYSIDKIANTVGHFDAYIKKKHPVSSFYPYNLLDHLILSV